MTAKKFYNHYKDGEHYVDCIAESIGDKEKKEAVELGNAWDHKGGIVSMYLYKGKTCVDAKEARVIYQKKGDYNTNNAYAMKVEDFHSKVELSGGSTVDRFTLK